MALSDKTIAILLAPRGNEEPEFAKPRDALVEAGATVVVVGLEPGEGETFNNDLDPGGKYPVDKTLDQVSADEFDLLVVPGGTVGADTFRAEAKVVAFAKAFAEQGKPIAAICHAPWLLIEAGVVDGKTLTSFPSLKTDITNAGGTWVDKEVVEGGGLITSRNPDDIPAFNAAIIKALS